MNKRGEALKGRQGLLNNNDRMLLLIVFWKYSREGQAEDALILIHSSIHPTVVLHTIAGGQSRAATNNPINVQVLKAFLHNSNSLF